MARNCTLRNVNPIIAHFFREGGLTDDDVPCKSTIRTPSGLLALIMARPQFESFLIVIHFPSSASVIFLMHNVVTQSKPRQDCRSNIWIADLEAYQQQPIVSSFGPLCWCIAVTSNYKSRKRGKPGVHADLGIISDQHTRALSDTLATVILYNLLLLSQATVMLQKLSLLYLQQLYLLSSGESTRCCHGNITSLSVTDRRIYFLSTYIIVDLICQQQPWCITRRLWSTSALNF